MDVDLDITSAEFKAEPHPEWRRLRREAPVSRVELAGKQRAWLVTRYDDVAIVLKDERFGKDRARALTPDQAKKEPWVPGFFRPLTRNMLDLDPPDHTRLRALVQKAFTPGRIVEMGDRIRDLTESLLDAAEERSGRGRGGWPNRLRWGNRGGGPGDGSEGRRTRIDLIADYALPIPTTIIAEMLGVPAEDHARFHRWSSTIVSSTPSTLGVLRAIPSLILFIRYIRKLVGRRRSEPRDDLISALVRAEEAGDRLDEDELLAMIFLLLVAGHETTVNLIGNGMLALLDHPGQLRRLRDDPSLIDSALEELLRFDGPLMTATERFTREDVVVAGTTIPQGSLVYAVLASANRDERQFPAPNELDIGRTPNRHLAFGHGVHHCLGAPLARLEGRIAFETLLRRTSDIVLEREREGLRWRRGLVLRGLENLPLSYLPAAAES